MEDDTEVVGFCICKHDELSTGGGLVVVKFIFAGSVGYEAKNRSVHLHSMEREKNKLSSYMTLRP